MKIVGDKLTEKEYQAIEGFVYSLNSIDISTINKYIFTVRKKDNILTIFSHHCDGYFLPSYKILSPDSRHHKSLVKSLNNCDVILELIVNVIPNYKPYDIYDNYPYHEYHRINSNL